MDNIKTWTGLSLEESIRMTKDRDKRRKYVHGVDRSGQRSRMAKEQNRTPQNAWRHIIPAALSDFKLLSFAARDVVSSKQRLQSRV